MIKNPLSPNVYSDPFITYDKDTGYYYFIASCQNHKLTIYRSRKLNDLIRNNESADVYVCEDHEAFGPLWAPEMYKINGRWYIYTSCQEEKSDYLWNVKRLLILKSKTSDPFDGFEFGSKPDTSIFAIDPTSTFINGKQYICYSEVDKNGVQILVIREMADPLTFTDKYAVIARPTLSWELIEPYTGNCAINEGAFFLKKGNRLFIVYSANGCWSDDYCLGVLEYIGGEVCDSNSWIKHPEPLFKKGNGIYGTGHASFFNSPDDSEVWCAYHILHNSNPDALEMPRHTCVQKIKFDDNDYPVMGEPIGTEKEFASPSGEEK